MGALNFLAQIIGICVAIYIGFTYGAGGGASLFLIVAVGHFALTKISNFLMFIHQRSLSQEQQREIFLRAQIEGAAFAAPAFWATSPQCVVWPTSASYAHLVYSC